MNENTEFQKIGKNTPYKVPAGFFEQVSENTLQKAKFREQNRRKILILWRSVAVAASLTGIALLGYYWSEPERTETQIMIVQEKQPDSLQAIQLGQKNARPLDVSEKRSIEPEKADANDINKEGINDVLADLSDEELLQLAALYKIDPFTNESAQ